MKTVSRHYVPSLTLMFSGFIQVIFIYFSKDRFMFFLYLIIALTQFVGCFLFYGLAQLQIRIDELFNQ